MSRLESPDVLVIGQRGHTVTIASPNAPTVTFESRDDGRGLDVTRRLNADRYTRPFVVRSFYDRTPDAAEIDR